MASLSFVFERIQQWQRSSALCNGKRLSGMPLLLYNSFVLWNCRELESIVGSTKYARFLWGIAVVSMLLEIWLTYCILSFLRDMNYGTSSPLFVMSRGVQPSAGVLRVKRMLVHRSMGSLTIVSTGVLTVFQHRFPNVPISVLPFVNAHHLFFVTPSIAYAFCLGVLSFLSHSAHPFSGVICGACAGLTWSANLTSFMMENYWASGSFLIYTLLCALSLKAAESSFVPCIDHMPWDINGRLPETQEPHDHNFAYSSRQDSSGNSNFESSGEIGNDIERNLWHYRRNDEVRHLIPNFEELDDHFNQTEQEIDSNANASTQAAPVESASNADAGVRSRRVLRS